MEKSEGADEQALLELMSRTGYTMLQENGQRKYGGPPPNWEGPPPQKGCEVFVGKIPRDCFEDELVPAFEKVGKIYELRLMMDFSGSNRGYAFVMFTNRNDAQKAVREMNNYEIRKGRLLGVCPSVDNCRLFVGGIPKNKTKEEILSEMEQVTDGVVDVIVYPSAMDKTKNRGFAFVEYLSHRMAAMARRKLIPGRIQLWGHQIAVDWAEPEQDVDEDIMRKVKILYVRNLMLGTTEDTIYKAFTKASGEEDVIERVKKLKDYAFVHFKDRDAAIKAMKAMDGTVLDCSRIEVVLAKPVDKAEYIRYNRCKNALPQSLAYGLQLRDPAVTMYPPMFTPQQAMMARGGMMLRGRGRGAAGMRGAGARHNFNMFRNPRYAPEGRLYDIAPGMELKPTNPDTLKPHSGKSYTEVTINGLNAPPFQPNKLCRTVDEAKVYAAEYVLQQLNVPLESTEMYMGAPLNMPMPMGIPGGMPGPQGPPMTDMYMPSVMKMPPPVPPPHMIEQFYHQGGYPMGPPPVSSMQAQY